MSRARRRGGSLSISARECQSVVVFVRRPHAVHAPRTALPRASDGVARASDGATVHLGRRCSAPRQAWPRASMAAAASRAAAPRAAAPRAVSLAPLPSARESCLTVAAFVVVSLAPAKAVLSSRVCSLNARRLARHRPGPRPSRLSGVSSRLPARPSSVDGALALAPISSAQVPCLTVAALVVVSLAPPNGGAVLVCVLSMHGTSRAIAPALDRLARVASLRGSPLGLCGRCRARARSISSARASCLTVAAFVVVSLASAHGGAVLVRMRLMRGASRALAPALGRLACVLHGSSRAIVPVHFSRTRPWQCCPRACALNARRLARHRSGPRPSRLRRVSLRTPRPAIFGRRCARARSVPSGRASCLTVAAFLVASLAPTSSGAAFARVLSMHGASRALAPALGRLARVTSHRGSPLGHLRST